MSSALAPVRHTIRSGETLTSIAKRYGVSVDDLAKRNAIKNRNRILSGSVLIIPGATAVVPVASPSASAASSAAVSMKNVAWSVKVPITVVAPTRKVVKGETWSSIAKRWSVDPAELARVNGRTTKSVLKTGQVLRLPTGAMDFNQLPDKLRASPARLKLAAVHDRWARAYGVPVDLFKAMTWMESGWQNSVVSYVGAVGIGQLMPATTKFINDTMIPGPALDPKVPEENIRMSARYLAYLLAVEDGDQVAALADYYQGQFSVDSFGVQNVTRNYVEVIMALKPRFATVA
ncbi:MAG: LysM peptidoglycan-binding domain-containing protein [Acidimicrobiia bacterium]